MCSSTQMRRMQASTLPLVRPDSSPTRPSARMLAVSPSGERDWSVPDRYRRTRRLPRPRSPPPRPAPSRASMSRPARRGRRPPCVAPGSSGAATQRPTRPRRRDGTDPPGFLSVPLLVSRGTGRGKSPLGPEAIDDPLAVRRVDLWRRVTHVISCRLRLVLILLGKLFEVIDYPFDGRCLAVLEPLELRFEGCPDYVIDVSAGGP